MAKNTSIELNEVVGCHLLTFLDGIDATNFIEAVNHSQQFRTIAKTLDYHFIKLINVFCGHERILLPRTLFEHYTDDCEIDDERLILVSNRYSSVIKPSERLYIHPCFSTEGFAKLCEVYQTSLFKCYCRLLPFNNFFYNADFGLLNYDWYGRTVGSERILNDHEKNLFKLNAYFNINQDQNSCSNMMFVHTMKEFKQNLMTRFASNVWLEAIDFSKWALVGGCVLNALCHSPFPDTKEQDINLVYCINDILCFKTSINATISSLNKMVSQNSTNLIKAEKIPGTPNYYVFLPCHFRLHFAWVPLRDSQDPLSHILYNFDMDICQVAFNGHKIVSTFPFLQALATKSFIVYTLHAGSPKHLCTRIAKYCNRGFKFLEPIDFDGDFGLLMSQEEIPLYRIEHQQYIDDNGEVQTATKEYRRPFLDNVDTFRMQEKFITMVSPQLLEYK